MKKILGLSLLAASLVSTSAFADPGQKVQAAQMLMGGQNSQAIAVVMSSVSDFRNDNSKNLKAIAIRYNSNNDVSFMTVSFVKKLTGNDHDVLQRIIMTNAKDSDCKVQAGSGSKVALLTCKTSNNGPEKMAVYSVEQGPTMLTIKKVEAAAGQQGGFGNSQKS